MNEKQDINAYVVLSVSDIRRMLRAAVRSQKAHKQNSTHCVIAKNVSVSHIENRWQICSFELVNSIAPRV